MKRFQELKISACSDKGAKKYFETKNQEGFDFKPKCFSDIGYFADGYDENKHIWIEYDTPYHHFPYQQKKDLERQNNIIKYFESVSKPLKRFIRVKVDVNEHILEEKCVYESN